MIKRKLKPCKGCLKDSYIFGKGLCTYCYHKGRKPPKKTSDKQRDRLKEYNAIRKVYLKDHPICEVCKVNKAEHIHHKRGRIGNNLFKDFLAVCMPCHSKIEENPKWAKEMGYSLSRIQ